MHAAIGAAIKGDLFRIDSFTQGGANFSVSH